MNKILCTSVLASIFFHSTNAYADIGRVYHPYVEQNEREIEYGVVWRAPDEESVLLQRLGAGYSFVDRLFAEVYVLTEHITHEGYQSRGYEFELKWQLTEQGEYWSDWGLLLESATADDISRHEFAVGLLWEKELNPRWITTVNLMLEREYGSDIEDEWESGLRAQFRYRRNTAFEPALEVYLDDQDWAAGPAIMGAQRIKAGQQIRWELGVVFGLDAETPANSIRLNLEYEF